MNPKTPQTSRRGPVIVYLILMLLMLFTVYKLFSAADSVDLKYSDVVNLFRDEKVEAFEIQSNTLKMKLKEEFRGQDVIKYRLADFSVFYNDLNDTIQDQLSRKVLTEYDVLPESQGA